MSKNSVSDYSKGCTSLNQYIKRSSPLSNQGLDEIRVLGREDQDGDRSAVTALIPELGPAVSAVAFSDLSAAATLPRDGGRR